MEPTTLTFAADDAPAATVHLAAGDSPRTLTGLAVPFGVASGADSLTGRRYVFSNPPSNADELVDVVNDHDPGALLGRLENPWQATESGLDATARVFDTTRGRDALTEAKEGARLGFSVGAAINAYTEDAAGVRHVTDWTAVHLGLVRRPAFASATVTRINASAGEENPMPPENETPPAPAVAELPTIAELAERVAEHLGTGDDGDAHPLAQFGTFEQFAAAFAAATPETREALQVAFAVPDQITPNNQGVIPPGWRTEIKMRLDARRPAIAGTGGPIGLPDSGMDSNWPYFDGSLDTIISQQMAEKQALSGVRIDIKKANEPIKTAGTVSDISYQLLMRSSPSYLQAYLRICLAAWARYTEAKFEQALVARGTNVGVLPALADAKALRTELFTASAAVEDATGAPAELVLVDPTTWVKIGGLTDLFNGKYGTQNAAGTASAATLKVDVNGLQIIRAPFLSANTMVVTNGDATRFAESGARVATQEDVVKLGRDVAVWGMYEDAEVYFPQGVRVYKPAA
ncbi:HK97 family phage prohead protease [Luteipulveratus sp. YIM 133132]|uniref:HK97 family phage prohead protease n=1 Tax=Luteipulveratus flavus TaxID=3031728 RepID=UPI0023B202BE|nr:HK97 family phage prohead protease [Luteipulveratus sp. YIM 133132]MDE9365474.1 HK97 family phage prohead protease [Luteipulveratus sp. YIM 133132]